MYHEIRYLKALQRIQELKMAGRWSFRQPKKQRGPIVHKTHWDYLMEEMVCLPKLSWLDLRSHILPSTQKWLQTDYREERKWKIAVAMDLAYAAAEWVNSDYDKRKTLTQRWTRVEDEDEDEQDADHIDTEMLEGSTPPPSKRRRLSPRPDDMDIESTGDAEGDDSEPQIRNRRRIAKLSQPVEDEEEDDEEDDDDDDRASLHSAIRDMSVMVPDPSTSAAPPPPPPPGPDPADIIIEGEQRPKEEPDLGSQSATAIDLTSDDSRPVPPISMAADNTTKSEDQDMDAEGEADEDGSMSRSRSASRPAGDASSASQQQAVRVKVEPKVTQDTIEADASVAPKDDIASHSEPLVVTISGLKPGRDDVPLSSTAGSLLDPKLLRSPILDLSFEDTTIDLSDIFNRGLSLEDREPDCDKDDISLQSLFPELSVYEFGTPPAQLPNGDSNSANDNNKKDKRNDESGMSVGRLTYTNRLMDGKNILLSVLQPGSKYRKGVWDDPSDISVTEEPRDYSKACPDPAPPTARK